MTFIEYILTRSPLGSSRVSYFKKKKSNLAPKNPFVSLSSLFHHKTDLCLSHELLLWCHLPCCKVPRRPLTRGISNSQTINLDLGLETNNTMFAWLIWSCVLNITKTKVKLKQEGKPYWLSQLWPNKHLFLSPSPPPTLGSRKTWGFIWYHYPHYSSYVSVSSSMEWPR